MSLPPDLARLGDDLVEAARRTGRARQAQRRRRFALAAISGAIAFAALTPAALEPSHVDLTIAAVDGFARPACDGRCVEPMVLHRPYAIQ